MPPFLLHDHKKNLTVGTDLLRTFEMSISCYSTVFFVLECT